MGSVRELRKKLNISDDVHKVGRCNAYQAGAPMAGQHWWRAMEISQIAHCLLLLKCCTAPFRPPKLPGSPIRPPIRIRIHTAQRMMEDIKMDSGIAALQSGSVPTGVGGAIMVPTPVAHAPPRLPPKPSPSE
jgi:hypothetical protein